MKKLLSICAFTIFNFFLIIAQEGIIIDHRHTDLSQIPDNWIDSAKNKLNVRYYRRSHGSQVDAGGMTALMNYSSEWETKYRYYYLPQPGALLFTSEFISVDYDSPQIYANARQFLNNPANSSANVVMFAWSFNFSESNIQAYLDSMENLIRDYGPDGVYIQNGSRSVPVNFIFQTACSLKDPLKNQIIHTGNQLIRQHCLDNNRILYDFADIEAYNPDGEYFGDANPDGTYAGQKLLDDDISYNLSEGIRGNWGIEWMNAHPSHELTLLAADNICTSCSHSNGDDPDEDNSRIHCVLKGRAAWWLFAKLAGWENSAAKLIVTADGLLTETNLNDIALNLSLQNESFKDNLITPSNIVLNNAPQGLSISSINYIDNQHLTINFSFNGPDFDSNIQNFNITISGTELSGNANLTSNNLLIDAFNERVQIAANPGLIEPGLNGSQLSISLIEETFKDNSVNPSNVVLNNEPQGLSISSINYIDNQHLTINFSFNGPDFDSNIQNFNITISGTELSGNANLSSNNLLIDAFNEQVQITPIQNLNETNLNGSQIDLVLTEESFSDNQIQRSNLILNNAPTGLSINSITYINNQQLSVFLNFTGIDFDNDITNFSISINEAELTGSSNITSNSLVITATNELPASAVISSSINLTEVLLDSSIINLTLINETFKSNLTDFQGLVLKGSPIGLSISQVIKISSTRLEVILAFDGTDFDEDSSKFCIYLNADLLTGNQSLETNKLTLFAENENSVLTHPAKSKLKTVPNPSNGSFTISFPEVLSGKYLIIIYNKMGQSIIQSEISLNDDKYFFNNQYLSDGIYTLKIVNNKKLYTGNLVIKNN